ncbi:MAG: 30S ribosomal protein S3 [Planctomycetota bacterium]|jgi:small subunit ribosomal protein S3|nr:30S ribosomal protein S3 [Planctomycetota bacterium]MDP7130601.1 30S ribosomal protein S3 [Planctomycetota bacterium]
MGQKVHPLSFRIAVTEPWRSRWYATKREFGEYLIEDKKIRNLIKENYKYAGIPRIDIERTREEIKVILHAARPGVIIGRKGAEVERLRESLKDTVERKIEVEIVEVPQPELEAQLVAEGVAEQLEKRAPFRRVLKKTIETAVQLGCQGIKIQISGRLGGAEMSRTERTGSGSIPLQTLRAKIDYGFTEAKTTYGRIGVKVWIYKGEVIGKEGSNASDA